MYTGSLPPASIYGTWVDNVAVYSDDDNTLMDLSDVTEVILTLRDPSLQFNEMVLKMSSGSITIPSQGIIQWRAEAGSMATLSAKLYKVIITVYKQDDIIPLTIGPLSVVE